MRKQKLFTEIIEYLQDTIENKSKSSNDSYKSKLLNQKINRIAQKVGEEAIEVVIASSNKKKTDTIYESADLLFHLMVLWKKLDIKLSDIAQELDKRKK